MRRILKDFEQPKPPLHACVGQPVIKATTGVKWTDLVLLSLGRYHFLPRGGMSDYFLLSSPHEKQF